MSDCYPYSPPNGDLSFSQKVLAEFNHFEIPFKVELIPADFIWVGKVNKCPEVEKIMSWPEFRAKAEAKLQELGKQPGIGYQIKSHLREAR